VCFVACGSWLHDVLRWAMGLWCGARWATGLSRALSPQGEFASCASCGADADTNRYLCCQSLASFVLRLQLPRWAASIFAILLALSVLAFVCYVVVNAITSIFSNVSQYALKISALVQTIVDLAAQLGIKISSDEIATQVRNLPLYNYALAVIVEILSIFATMAIMLIFILYLMLNRKPAAPMQYVGVDHEDADDPSPNSASSISTAPADLEPETLIDKVENEVFKYVGWKSVISFVTAISVLIILASLNAPLAGLFALLTFFFKFIPSVGSMLTTVLPLPLIWLSPDHTATDVFLALGLIQGVQILVGEILEPKLLGDGLALHPATVLFALLVWTSLWGVVGAFLAVPLTCVVKIVCKELSDQPIANFIHNLLEGNFGDASVAVDHISRQASAAFSMHHTRSPNDAALVSRAFTLPLPQANPLHNLTLRHGSKTITGAELADINEHVLDRDVGRQPIGTRSRASSLSSSPPPARIELEMTSIATSPVAPAITATPTLDRAQNVTGDGAIAISVPMASSQAVGDLARAFSTGPDLLERVAAPHPIDTSSGTAVQPHAEAAREIDGPDRAQRRQQAFDVLSEADATLDGRQSPR
jgi:AI-2 transport protein TqsA